MGGSPLRVLLRTHRIQVHRDSSPPTLRRRPPESGAARAPCSWIFPPENVRPRRGTSHPIDAPSATGATDFPLFRKAIGAARGCQINSLVHISAARNFAGMSFSQTRDDG